MEQNSSRFRVGVSGFDGEIGPGIVTTSCGGQFLAVWGASLDYIAKVLKNHQNDGFYPTWLDAWDTKNDEIKDKAVLIMERYDGAWSVKLKMTLEELHKSVTKKKAMGMVIDRIVGYHYRGQEYFHAVFIKPQNKASHAEGYGYSQTEMTRMLEDYLMPKGFTPVSLTGYEGKDGTAKYVISARREGLKGWKYDIHIPEKVVHDVLKKRMDENMAPTSIDAYNIGKDVFFCMIYQPRSFKPAPWSFTNELSIDEMNRHAQYRLKQQFGPISITGYLINGKTPQYAVLWNQYCVTTDGQDFYMDD